MTVEEGGGGVLRAGCGKRRGGHPLTDRQTDRQTERQEEAVNPLLGHCKGCLQGNLCHVLADSGSRHVGRSGGVDSCGGPTRAGSSTTRTFEISNGRMELEIHIKRSEPDWWLGNAFIVCRK